MDNLIITGSTGFIGKLLLKKLLDKKYKVSAIVRKKEKLGDLLTEPNLTVIEKDLEEIDVIDFHDISYDGFFHLGWGGVNRKDIDKHEIHLQNYKISVHCLKIALSLGCHCFIDGGSKAEYGMQKGKHIESMICNPYTAYGKEKLHFYDYAKSFCRTTPMIYIHPRFFSVLGVSDHPWSLIISACTNFINNKDMYFGSCQQLWNYMSVDDATTALIMLYENSNKLPPSDNNIFNIASYDTRILRSFIEEIYILTNSRSNLFFKDSRLDSNTTDYMYPEIEKLTNFIHWKPERTFEQEIRRIINNIKGVI